MKKIVFLIFILSISAFAQAQHGKKSRGNKSVIKWLSLGVKGGYGNSVLLNSDVSGDKNVTMNYLTPSYFFGGRLTFTYGDVVGLGAELNASHFGQKYNIKTSTQAYTKNLKISSQDFILFLRFSGESGGYFEIGPKFTTLKTITVTNSGTGNFNPETDFINYYTPKYTGIMLGAGLSVVRTERFSLHLGIRGSYAFSDMVSDHNHYILDDFVYHPSYLPVNAKTNPLAVQAVLEAEYFFAFFGNASCGKGRLMFFQ
jgi:hypothetical protein